MSNEIVTSARRMLSAKEACQYIGMGRNRGIEFLKEIGCEHKIGKRCLYDRAFIDRYFDAQAEED